MVFKCKMCGGDITPIDGTNTGKCDYCKSVMTLPNLDDEKIVNLYNRANFLRIENEFDKAKEVYENILSIDNNQIEAHWGLLLCKYGVEYVDDPKTKKKIPTCHRTLDTSILTDKDFKIIKKESYGDALELYEKEAEYIDKIQKDILAISLKEKPYDIFICYKETDDHDERTHDSVLAQDIYDKLVEQGLKVFFARITLEDKLGVEYEPYIYSALKSSKVMLVVGTKEEYFNAVWVKNEWSRYLEMMQQDKGKSLIPVYSKIDAYKLPEEFAMLQAQSMDKVGAMQDLVRGVKKLVNEYKEDGISDYDQQTIAKVASALDDARSIGNGKYEVTIVKENLPTWYYVVTVLSIGALSLSYLFSLAISYKFLLGSHSLNIYNVSIIAFISYFLSYLCICVGLLSCFVRRKFIKFKKSLFVMFMFFYFMSFVICLGKGYYPSSNMLAIIVLLFPLIVAPFAYLYNPQWQLNMSNKSIMDKEEKDKQIAKNKKMKDNFTLKEKPKVSKIIVLLVLVISIGYCICVFIPDSSSVSNTDNEDYIEVLQTTSLKSNIYEYKYTGYVKAGKYKIIDIDHSWSGDYSVRGDYIKIKTGKGKTGWIKMNYDNTNIVYKYLSDEKTENDNSYALTIHCNETAGMCNKYYNNSNNRDTTVDQVQITTGFIRIRDGVGVDYDIKGLVIKNNIFTVLEKKNTYNNNTWYLIETNNGIRGWIAGKYNNEQYVKELVKEN